MYSQGESFYYNIDDEEFELTVLENLIIRDKEYLITEDFDGNNYVFLYDDDELEYIDDTSEVNSILDYWKDEYLNSENIGDWDEDEYYDREDSYDNSDLYESDYDEKDYY